MAITARYSFIALLFTLLKFHGNSQFLGGKFDGSSNALLATNNCNSISVSPFSGGINGGFAKAHFGNVCNAIAVSPFSGGVADGYAGSRFGDTCYSISVNPFSGGIADGFSNIRYGDSCNAITITPFAGGLADGFSSFQTTNEICYSISVSPFSGGNADGFAQFSHIVVDPETCTPLIPLPINLLYFDAIKEIDRVRTKWVTLSERDNDYFTVEKSTDGYNWKSLGKINGAGNSTYEIEYTLYDLEPEIGFQYYRLKQTDFNGDYEYSTIKSVLFEEENTYSITVFPNPTHGNINMSVSGKALKNSTITIFSSLGKTVYHFENFSGNNKTFDLSRFERGIYFLRVIDNNESKVFRIIKQ
ncbi:T9SS type A sorting domain-containing protein [Brumimicrobium oceani]|uniref:Secretion system C-terminal sorting domain-containing protein n=1 Tax=Brumimicrobium oceani TaxID=2100725 RepID=A0A2U2X556_9FLAO|nr:T9SS type A sorting domain-containing protein [Brumimicrobium oceani]PWH82925.1 hypothetical protein DIT68_13595 [Brumimicrobium oceani]